MGAAAEACSRRSDGTVLKGFWVRNKGFHATAMALGQILPARSDALGIDGMGITPMGGGVVPPRWAQLDGPEEGSRKRYNEHLASRPIVKTIDEAHTFLLQEFE